MLGSICLVTEFGGSIFITIKILFMNYKISKFNSGDSALTFRMYI